MKRVLTRRQENKFKFLLFSAGLGLAVSFLSQNLVYAQLPAEYAGPYSWQGESYDQFIRIDKGKGYIDEYTSREAGFCHSYMVNDGLSLMSTAFLACFYAIVLGYLFLGIAIVSDIFMEAIEEITSKTSVITIQDADGNDINIEKKVWNPTIANLSLMALGSSAPEILLSCIETLQFIEDEPGELGASTIVGSAAFNLLIISAVSILAVDEVKKVDAIGVFVVTSIASIFAYVWMFVCLVVWTPEIITLAEALLTLSFFFLLIFLAYIADKINEKQRKAQETIEDTERLEKEKKIAIAKTYLRQQASQFGQNYVIECVTGGSSAAKATGEDREEVKKNFRNVLEVDTLDEVDINMLLAALEPERLLDRLQYRKNASGTGRKAFVKLKGQRQQMEMDVQTISQPNEKIGFKCMHYSVTESSGFVEITVVKKVPEDIVFWVQTRDGSATEPDDYEKLEQLETMQRNEKEKVIRVKVINDDIWEPDKDFHVDLCSEVSKERLEGGDTTTTVTILDEDNPGIIGFSESTLKVRKKDKFAFVRIVRTDGADGPICCMCRTESVKGIKNQATAFTDFIPFDDKLEFAHQETEKLVKVELFQAPILGEEEQKDNKAEDEEPKDDHEEDEDEEEEDNTMFFELRLDNPSPDGVKISRTNNILFIKIVPDDEEFDQQDAAQKKLLEYLLQQKEATWGQQFKAACMLGPSIDEDNLVEDVTYFEAFMHFFSIGWKVLFSCIPPRRLCGGWFAFVVALGFIGIVTAVVGEFANLFGCVLGVRQAVTAITFVALGTSLPDTFASKTAAQNEEFADASVGNITGSNSVNVFLGLGLPWTMASIYNLTKHDRDYRVIAGTLSFSVVLFLSTSVCGFLILCVRRRYIGGELGGPKLTKIISSVLFIMLWLIYITFSTLQTYDIIEGFE